MLHISEVHSPVIRNGINVIVMSMSIYSSTSSNKTSLMCRDLQEFEALDIINKCNSTGETREEKEKSTSGVAQFGLSKNSQFLRGC